MEKVRTSGRNDCLVQFSTGKAVLTYGYWEEEQDGEMVGYSWQHTWHTPPSNQEVVDLIVSAINTHTDERILSGYVWKGVNVWLSQENQFNFKAAYDVAVQANGAILPITFKLGERDGAPVYHTFNDMTEFAGFYTGAIAFIQNTLAEGWAEKDAARRKFETND